MNTSGPATLPQARLRGISLSMRGVGFLTFGIGATATALVYGHRDLLRVGLLLAFVPLVSAALLLRMRPRLEASRSVSPGEISVGQEARIAVQLSNTGRSSTGTLLVEDTVPLVLGARPRWLVPALRPRPAYPSARDLASSEDQAQGVASLTYVVRSSSRGRYTIGPLVLRVSDPLGMWELRRRFATEDTLLVTPRTIPLPNTSLRALSAGGNRTTSMALAGADDVGIREYRHGDPVHRVHWRATARYGEVMVRREEQPERPTATLLLDTRPEGYVRSGRRSAFDDAVSVIASVGVALTSQGHTLRVSSSCDASLIATGRGEDPRQTARRLLQALAHVDVCPGGAVPGHGHCALPVAPPSGTAGLVVAVLGGVGTSTDSAPDVATEQASGLAGWRASASTALALVVTGPVRPGMPTTESNSERLLRSSRWTVARLATLEDLPEAWRSARGFSAAGVGA